MVCQALSLSLVVANIAISASFKYLGIQITNYPLDYIHLNLALIPSIFRNKVKVWPRLKMSFVGWTNLAKMILMPQIL